MFYELIINDAFFTLYKYKMRTNENRLYIDLSFYIHSIPCIEPNSFNLKFCCISPLPLHLEITILQNILCELTLSEGFLCRLIRDEHS